VDRFIESVGADPVEIDVRIIAATQRNLEDEVAEGNFREDLFYHLNVVPLHIPPLRDHKEDVPELLNHYVESFVAQEKLPYRHFDMGSQNFLRNHDWRGNIRELKNLVQRLLILGAGEEITQEEVESALGGGAVLANMAQFPMALDQPLRQAREEFERVYFEYQLDKHSGNVSRMAEEVGMERTHLYRKLRALGIEIKDRR